MYMYICICIYIFMCVCVFVLYACFIVGLVDASGMHDPNEVDESIEEEPDPGMFTTSSPFQGVRLYCLWFGRLCGLLNSSTIPP